MWDIGFFTKEKMIEWEKKDPVDQTLTNVKDFLDKAMLEVVHSVLGVSTGGFKR